MENVGNRIKLILKDKKLSQNKLASVLGISSGNISDIIKCKNNPSASTLALLAEQLKVNLNWLLTGEGEMYTGSPPGSQQPDQQKKISELEAECLRLREELKALGYENKKLDDELKERLRQMLGLQDKLINIKC